RGSATRLGARTFTVARARTREPLGFGPSRAQIRRHPARNALPRGRARRRGRGALYRTRTGQSRLGTVRCFHTGSPAPPGALPGAAAGRTGSTEGFPALAS